MREFLTKEIPLKLSYLFIIVYTLWFLSFHLFKTPFTNQTDWFSVTYGIIALWGCIWGLITARKWGSTRSILGKSIILFSLGLGFQEIGQLIYTYFIYFLGIEVPYPSIGDVFFYGTIPFYITAVIYLGLASGIHISLRLFKNKVQAIAIPLVLLMISYLIFLQNYEFDWTKPLVILLDFGVPFGQAIYISIAILTYTLSNRVLGGIMKSKMLLFLAALSLQFIADWTFLFQASQGSWVPGGISDYIFLISYFMMTFALLQMNTAFKKIGA